MANFGFMPIVPGYPPITTSINSGSDRPRPVGQRLPENAHSMLSMEYLMTQEQKAVEFLAAVRNDLGAPSEAADRASKPAINNFNPPVAEFTFSFPTPNSMSAQNLTNERPMDIMRRIVTPPAASSLAPYHGGTDAVTQGTPDPPEPTLWAFMQRDGFPLFPPPTGSVLELAISLAFPRPADENVLRGWPLMEHLLYESLIKDEKSQFLST